MTEKKLPSLISNPSSIRRDVYGLLDERCLTPRSKLLRDRVAAELRLEVLRQYEDGETPINLDVDLDGMDIVKRGSVDCPLLPLPTLLDYSEKHSNNQQRKKNVNRTEEDKWMTVFHTVMVLLMRDSICWNRLIFCEALGNHRVRRFAAQLGTDLQSSFVECTKDKFHPVRRLAIQGFRVMAEQGEQMDKEAAAAHLGTMATRDPDGRLRAEAVRVMKAMGVKAIPHLARVQRESSFWPVRCEAALSLGSIGCWRCRDTPREMIDGTLQALQDALNDPVVGCREAAAMALGGMGKEALRAVQNLIMLTRDQDLRVRIAAVKSLGDIVAEAAKIKPLKYERLMVKADIEHIAQSGAQLDFADSLRLTCRALTCTLRDQEPLFSVALAAAELDNPKVDAFRTPESSLVVSRLRQRELNEVERQRRFVKKLYHQAEVALAEIGPYCAPNMVARLIEEDADNAGFGNRMSLLRGLHCSGSGFATEETVCVILSEWVGAPQLSHFSNTIAVANSIPVAGLHMETFLSAGVLRYAVLRDQSNSLYLVFGITNHHKALDALLSDVVPMPKEVRVAGEPGNMQTVGVHTGMWDLLDGLWPDIQRSVLEKLDGLERIIICGSCMGGAVAKMVTVRMHTTDGDMLQSIVKPEKASGEKASGEKASGEEAEEADEAPGENRFLRLRTYGAPNVLHGLRPNLLYLSHQSKAVMLEGDLLPHILGERTILGMSTSTLGVHAPKKGCCLHRNKAKKAQVKVAHASRYAGLMTTELLQPSPNEKRAISGLHVSVKAYTNSMCWWQLTQMMSA